MRGKINSLMDDMVEYLMDCRELRPLSKIFSAYTFSYQYRNSKSKFFSDPDILEVSWKNLFSGKEEWDKIIARKPNHTRDVVSWVMMNYLKITNELSKDRREVIERCILSVADEATTYSQRALIFLDIPNHAILRALACEYAYFLTGKRFYRRKAQRMRSYILHRFKNGISPELSLNYSPFNLILLSHLYEFTRDSRLLDCIWSTAEIIPVFIHSKTGDAVGIDNREAIKTVSITPYGCLCASMIMAARLIGDPKYISIAESAVRYIEKYTEGGACRPFPRWLCNPEITDTTRVIETMSVDTVTAIISYYLAMSDYYLPENLPRFSRMIKNSVKTSGLCVIKKTIGEAEAVISNIYPSPVAYVTPETSLIGWVPSEGMYRRTRMSYFTSSNGYAYVYSHPTRSHSTAFFHEDYILWVHTIEKNDYSDVYWSALLSVDPSEYVLCQKEGEIIKSKITDREYPLEWVLLPYKERYIGLAVFGSARLEINNEIRIVYKRSGLPSSDSSSVLLVGEWNGEAEEWKTFLGEWNIIINDKKFIIKTPNAKYEISYKSHHTVKRIFSRITDAYKKLRVFV
ncbi:hypothetical protein DRP04_08845 [Archaeoglobales archaeon]|nr:MAG: hypothetical protein DRP04_08845 [Archaeoglobales archaeon]